MTLSQVYLFESDKERVFRMERRKFYEQNKKTVKEILKIGEGRQIQAGYPKDVCLPDKLHNRIWKDAGKGKELTCVLNLYVLEDGPQSFYNFHGDFHTPSTILGNDIGTDNIEDFVKEIKQILQSDILYGAACKGWFYTFSKPETLSTAAEGAQAQQNFVQNIKGNPEFLRYVESLAENEEQKQTLTESLNKPLPETYDLIIRGLTPEERKEFVRIYNA